MEQKLSARDAPLSADELHRFQCNRYWTDILLDRPGSAVGLRPPAGSATEFWLVLLSVKDWNQEADWRQRSRLGARLAEDICSYLHCEQFDNGCVKIENELYFAVLCGQTFPNRILLMQACENLIKSAMNKTGCSLCCYFAAQLSLDGLCRAADVLMQADLDNVNGRPLIPIDQAGTLHTVELHPDYRQWRYYFTEQKFDQLLIELKACLMPDDTELPVSRASLMQFVQDFNQLLYVALQERQIPARLIFATERGVELLRKAENSVSDAINWCFWAVTQFSRHITQENATKTYIEQAEDYINSHLSQDFTRQDIADHVHLSQNHLARLFKRETGMSIADYITQERMKLAFDLLQNTDLPVGDVSLRVGYENYSYFLTLFRRITGMRPSEYRRQYRTL